MKLGDKMKIYREQLGLSQKELAAICTELDKSGNPWGQPRIANYEKNNRTPNLDDIEIIAKALNVSPETLAFDQNIAPVKLRKSYCYPLLSGIQAGTWTDCYDYADSTGYDYLESEIYAGEDAFFLKISGQSMEPKFSEGDLVLIDTRKRPHPGDFVAAVNGTGEATFKQYKELGEYNEFGNAHFELIPLNPVFPTMSTKNQDIRIIGVAVEHRRYL